MSMSENLRHHLAAQQHATWSRCIQDLFSCCTQNPDGSMTIPRDRVALLTRQMMTEYRGLNSQEHEPYRRQADSIITALTNDSTIDHALKEELKRLQAMERSIEEEKRKFLDYVYVESTM